MSQWPERLFRALHDFHRLQAQLANRLGTALPPGEFFFLHRLCELSGRKGRGEVSASDLCDKHHMSRPAVSQMMRSLEGKGLIERKVSPNDRRRTAVSATPEGRAMVRRALDAMDGYMDGIIARFGEANARKLVELLEGLNQVIQQEREGEVGEP